MIWRREVPIERKRRVRNAHEQGPLVRSRDFRCATISILKKTVPSNEIYLRDKFCLFGHEHRAYIIMQRKSFFFLLLCAMRDHYVYCGNFRTWWRWRSLVLKSYIRLAEDWHRKCCNVEPSVEMIYWQIDVRWLLQSTHTHTFRW